MEFGAPGQKVARFGPYEADVRQRVLTKGGLKVRLRDQPFQVLAWLLERPGELVTREEIQQKLWPRDTYVAFDDGLNIAIKTSLGSERYCGQSSFYRDRPSPGLSFRGPGQHISRAATRDRQVGKPYLGITSRLPVIRPVVQTNLPGLTCLAKCSRFWIGQSLSDHNSRPTAERWSRLRHRASGNASRTR